MAKLLRFQLFGFDNYYPSGGSNDVIAEAEALDGLIEAMREKQRKMPWASRRDDYEILDLQERAWLDAPTVKALVDKALS